ncbi:MAG: hypothetical protein IPK98_08410 [Chloracidobacterium sp.]|nr:hypothetical protein [Chloracidobacterium sp.]
MKKLFSTFAVIGVLFVLGAGIVVAQDATEVTDNFYATLRDLNVRGLPDKDQLKELKPFLSSQIVTIIKRNQKTQAAFMKKHPDEKPPWAEGDLFSSLFEGPTSYQIGNIRTKGSTREVDIYLHHVSESDKVKWTDTVVLKKFGGKWLVTNIIFKGKWQFKSGSSLLNALK